MRKWHPSRIMKTATRAYHRIGTSDTARHNNAVRSFAEKHHLVYFHSISAEDKQIPVISGSTMTPGFSDDSMCVGSHAGYDLAFVERASEARFEGFASATRQWYVLEIDLKHAKNMPYTFIGTKQQTKAFYANVLTSRPDARHIQLRVDTKHRSRFHSRYAVISVNAGNTFLERLFDEETVSTMTMQRVPYAIEIDNDSVIVITEAQKPREQLIDKLLHYGLWFAKRIDEKMS